MQVTLRIAWREFAALFATPLAWVFLSLSQFILAWLLLTLTERYQQQYQPLLVKLNASLGVTDLVVVPYLADPRLLMLLLLAAALLAMRLLAEERRHHTLPLLLAAPVSSSEIILGKYLGALGFALLLALLWGGMPFALQLGTQLDLGRMLAGLLGLFLLLAALCALALWVSAWSAQPAVAAVGAFVGGLLLLLLQQGGDAGVLGYLSILSHYEGFLRGQIRLADLAYFGLLIGGLLAFTVRRLDALRVQA